MINVTVYPEEYKNESSWNRKESTSDDGYTAGYSKGYSEAMNRVNFALNQYYLEQKR